MLVDNVVVKFLKRYKGLLITLALLIVASLIARAGYYIGSDHVKGLWAAADNSRLQQEKKETQLRDQATAKLQLELDSLKKLYDAEQLKRTLAYQEGIQNEKERNQATIDNLKSTNSGLWVQLSTTESKARAAQAALSDARNESSSIGAAYAELSTAYSESLLRIAEDGDIGIRQLGLCQTEYTALHAYTDKLVDIINQYPDVLEAALKVPVPK